MAKHLSTIEKTEMTARHGDGWHPDGLAEKYSKDRPPSIEKPKDCRKERKENRKGNRNSSLTNFRTLICHQAFEE